MEKKRVWMIVVAAGMLFLLGGCVAGLPVDTTTPRMTVEELRTLLGTPSVIVVDVRLEDEWKVSRWKIKGAVREDPEKDINSWVGKYPKEKTLVFYCS